MVFKDANSKVIQKFTNDKLDQLSEERLASKRRSLSSFPMFRKEKNVGSTR